MVVVVSLFRSFHFRTLGRVVVEKIFVMSVGLSSLVKRVKLHSRLLFRRYFPNLESPNTTSGMFRILRGHFLHFSEFPKTFFAYSESSEDIFCIFRISNFRTPLAACSESSGACSKSPNATSSIFRILRRHYYTRVQGVVG